MSKRLHELGISVDMKIDSREIIAKANERLNAIPSERKAFMRYKKTKIAVIAAAFTILCIVTALAADNIISYFNSDKAKEVGDAEVLSEYSESICKTVIHGDKVLTLDDIAVDDSYLYVFFTLTAPENFCFDMICRIDGEMANNWASWDSYMVDENTGKGAIKISVAHKDLPEVFNFEMYCVENVTEDNNDSERYYQEQLTLTDEEKGRLLYISEIVHKADIKSEALTKEVNVEIPSLNAMLNKIVISPFGSQLVITQHELNRRYMSDRFVLQDENGNFIHIVRENSRIYDEGDNEEIRTVPIMLNGFIPKSLTIVPYGEEPEISIIDASEQKLDDLPVELKIGNRGKVIVTAVRYSEAKLEIDYKLEGNTWGLQMIYPVNNEGSNEMHAEDGVWWLDETEYHQANESYTAVFNFVIGEADQNGNVPSAGDMRSADILREKFRSVQISYQTNVPELDYDNAIKIDLK